MRDKKHYEKMLSENPNASVGFSLAAQAVYSAKNGVFDQNADDHNDAKYRDIARMLQQKYGENLSVAEVRLEMGSFQPLGSMIVRKIPQDLARTFKSRCAADGISQQDKIIELMREYAK